MTELVNDTANYMVVRFGRNTAKQIAINNAHEAFSRADAQGSDYWIEVARAIRLHQHDITSTASGLDPAHPEVPERTVRS